MSYQPSPPPQAHMHSVNPTITDTPSWLLDSGATNHITGDLNNLHLHHPYQGTDQVTVGNGNTLPIHNTGNGPLPTPSHSFQLRNVLHVPGIQSNLLSVQRFAHDNHCIISFDSQSFVIQDKLTKRVLYRGSSNGGLYPIPPLRSVTPSSVSSPRVFSSVKVPVSLSTISFVAPVAAEPPCSWFYPSG